MHQLNPICSYGIVKLAIEKYLLMYQNLYKFEPVDVWGDGELVRDYLYISDLMHAFQLALENNVSGIFNIGSGKCYSINQIIKKIEEVSMPKFDVNYVEVRECDVKRAVLDIEKANKLLGWTPQVNLDDGLNKYINWLQAQ